MPHILSEPLTIGDWVQVKVKWRGDRHGKPGISVVAGIIVEEDDRCMGYQQVKLDNGMWFCPQSDEIMRHEPVQR